MITYFLLGVVGGICTIIVIKIVQYCLDDAVEWGNENLFE